MAMKFHRSAQAEPEINLIPFIDILLVIVIFLMLTTTYSKYTELQLNLPVADGASAQKQAQQITIAINNEGQFSVNKQVLQNPDVQSLSQALLAATRRIENPLIVIQADAKASHQSVMKAMEAARRNGLTQLTFATQSTSGKN